jgi:hypothetical protein
MSLGASFPPAAAGKNKIIGHAPAPARPSERDPPLRFLDVTLVPDHSSKRWINTLLDCADISQDPGGAR